MSIPCKFNPLGRRGFPAGEFVEYLANEVNYAINTGVYINTGVILKKGLLFTAILTIGVKATA